MQVDLSRELAWRLCDRRYDNLNLSEDTVLGAALILADTGAQAPLKPILSRNVLNQVWVPPVLLQPISIHSAYRLTAVASPELRLWGQCYSALRTPARVPVPDTN